MKTILKSLSTSDGVLRLFDGTLKVTLLLTGLLLAIVVMRRIFKTSAARRASVLLFGAMAVPVIALSSFAMRSHPALWELEVAPTVEIPQAPEPKTPHPIGVAINYVATKLNMPSANPPLASPAEPPASPALGNWIVRLWSLGIGLSIAGLAFGIVRLNRRARSISDPVDSGPLARAPAEVCAESGIKRVPVLLLARSSEVMPMTWGAWRHRIMLPGGAISWSTDRLNLVLRHELAHIKRRDCLADWSMHLLLAPVWFHPLAWIVSRHARDLRERACDDAVNQIFDDVDSYARELVNLSRCETPSSGALAMARPRKLEARIRAMYCQRVGRGSTSWLTRASIALVMAASVVVAGFFTACRTTESAAPAEKQAAIAEFVPWGQTIEVSPKPRFSARQKKIILHVYEVGETVEPAEGIQFDEALGLIKGVLDRGETILTRDTMDKLAKSRANGNGSLIEGMPVDAIMIPVGKRHTIKAAENYIFPGAEGEPAQLGLNLDALAKPSAAGRLSVSTGYTATSVDHQPKADGTLDSKLVTISAERKTFSIENGGGIILGITGHDLSSTSTYVPILGALPGIGELFAKHENYRTRKILVLSAAME